MGSIVPDSEPSVLWITASSEESLPRSDALSGYDAVLVDQLMSKWGILPEPPLPGQQLPRTRCRPESPKRPMPWHLASLS